VLDDGKLNEWLNPLCEHNHASSQGVETTGVSLQQHPKSPRLSLPVAAIYSAPIADPALLSFMLIKKVIKRSIRARPTG